MSLLFDNVEPVQPSAESVAQRQVALANLGYLASVESVGELELNPEVTSVDLERSEGVMSEVDKIVQEPEVSAEALACAHDLVELYRRKLFRRAQLQPGLGFSAEAVSTRKQSISAESVRGGVRAILSLVQQASEKLAA